MAQDSQQARFLEDLNNLKDFAKVNLGKVSESDIREYFQDVTLTKEQLTMVIGFLRAGGIQVEGHTGSNAYTAWEERQELEQEKKNEAQDGSPKNDADNLDIYLEELAKAPAVPEEECGYLLMEAEENKTSDGTNRLAEALLPKVLDLVQPFVGKGVAADDLVQEGNLILFSYIQGREWLQDPEWADLIRKGSKEDLIRVLHGMLDVVRKKIEAQSRQLLTEQNVENDVSKEAVQLVRRVSETAKALREKMGRKVTPAEVADALGTAPETVTQAIEFAGSKIPDIENKATMRPKKIGPV